MLVIIIPFAKGPILVCGVDLIPFYFTSMHFCNSSTMNLLQLNHKKLIEQKGIKLSGNVILRLGSNVGF